MQEKFTDDGWEERIAKARKQGMELADAYREERILNSDPYRHLKRYCRMATMESLRSMADQFAIAHEDEELEIVCDEIEIKTKELNTA